MTNAEAAQRINAAINGPHRGRYSRMRYAQLTRLSSLLAKHPNDERIANNVNIEKLRSLDLLALELHLEQWYATDSNIKIATQRILDGSEGE